jgi:hypothetical protein
VLGVVTRALSAAAKRCAGIRAETGAVTFIQRFGSALNLNIHLNLIVAGLATPELLVEIEMIAARDQAAAVCDAAAIRVGKPGSRAGTIPASGPCGHEVSELRATIHGWACEDEGQWAGVEGRQRLSASRRPSKVAAGVCRGDRQSPMA